MRRSDPVQCDRGPGGEYVCKVSNYIGEANQSAWLTVTDLWQGNGELEGPLCWGLMEAPSCQGSCGEGQPHSPCEPAVSSARAMEKYPAWGGWIGPVLCWCHPSVPCVFLAACGVRPG